MKKIILFTTLFTALFGLSVLTGFAQTPVIGVPTTINGNWTVNGNAIVTGFLAASTLIPSGLTPGASPVCANGTSGALTNVGCSGGGGTTTNALTAAATGGAAPGSTFNGSAAVTFDYHSFGAASPQQVQQETFSYAADSGSANAYAVTLSPVPSLVAGEPVIFKAANANTGASTLAVNGGSPIAIYKQGGMTALAAGDIVAGQLVRLEYDGTYYQMQSQSGIAPATLKSNTFTGNQTAPGLTLSTVANAAAPTGVATTVGGQSVPASTTNEAAITCTDASGTLTTVGTASANVTTTGSASYIVWSYTLPSGCTTGYIWLNNTGTGSFAYYSVASGTSFQQNAAYTTYTAAASYPVGGAYPKTNTTGSFVANSGTATSIYLSYSIYRPSISAYGSSLVLSSDSGSGSASVVTTGLQVPSGDSPKIKIDLNGLVHYLGAAPTASAGTVATYSTNTGGEITGLSAATSVTITFANSGWYNAAFCGAWASTTLATNVYNSAQSAAAVTFTFPALTGNLFYHCDGN